MEHFIGEHGDPSKIAYRSNSMLARKAAIEAGLGLGFLGAFMGDGEPCLERIDLDLPVLSSDLWMVLHVDLRRNARVRAFVDFVFERLVEERHRFAP